ncbi:hypothetical protein CPB83DRAFT_842182 [Crepidotus variabilis]|uniref:Uncharacterized protein n=1 Tax=Crepidotus variabilis TaxID=179855 RepID=A0A9P6JX75_9AGAR|nr:hypothetical protein CPB83DRAFT_842182 [Crepidotus variabilis]
MLIEAKNKMFYNLWILAIFPQTFARFTLDTCWSTDCVLQTSTGQFCYYPGQKITTTRCINSQEDLAMVMEAHFRQDLSIAYYNGVDNTRLGGVNFTVPDDKSIIRLCVSGRTAGGGYYSTLCVNGYDNNVLQSSPYCEIAGAPKVSDGCYEIANSTTTIANPSATHTPLSSNSSARKWISHNLLLPFLLHIFCILL